MILANTHTNGRLGNQVFRNLIASFISQKQKIKPVYSQDLSLIGINLHSGNENIELLSLEVVNITDEECLEYIKEYRNIKNILSINNIYCQTPELARLIYDFIQQLKPQIEKLNPCSYENNNVFVHIRLGDASINNHGFEYYDKVLSSIKFDNGFISSDDINNELCILLIQKYNLIPFQDNEPNTIFFGSACKHIILSNGTFSWLIGAYGFYSDVYYPKMTLKPLWHGDIFGISKWNEIDYV